MIFKECLNVCSVESVVREIHRQYRKAPADKQQLLQQINQLIQKMQGCENYPIFDELFCFMAVPKTQEKDSVYVGLYDVAEKDIVGGWENYKINKVKDWGFLDNQSLGIAVFEPSLKKYGVDCIVAGVLGFILYFE